MLTTKAIKSHSLSVVVFGFFLAIVFRLRDRDLEFIVEPDFDVVSIGMWQQYLATGTLSALWKPGPSVYLDGHNLLYAAVKILLEWLGSLFPSLAAYFPNQDSYAFGAALFLNAVSYSIGCWFLYQTVLKLSRSVPIALAAAAAVCLSPPMLAIALVRVDWLIFGPYLAVLYVSVLMCIGDYRPRYGILLGVALGLVATMKVSGIAFAALPFFALTARSMTGQRPIVDIRFIVLALAAFAVVAVVLMHRHLVYLDLGEFVRNIRLTFEELARWKEPYKNNPKTYYLLALFMRHGIAFIVLYFCAFAYCVYIAARQKNPVGLFLVLSILFFVATATFTLRYDRGGYHLLPLYVVAAAFMISAFWQRALEGRRAYGFAAGLFGLALLSTIPYGVESYRTTVSDLKSSAEMIALTKRAPRAWLKAHVPLGETLCLVVHSNWALPIQGLNYKFEYAPFRFPYLDEKAMSTFAPPPLEALEVTCPVIVFSGFHKDMHLAQSSQASAEMGRAWMQFYSELSLRFPPLIFEAADKKWRRHTVEIYDLRGKGGSYSVRRSPR